MSFKPLENRVLVKRAESEEKSAGGIIIPETAKDKPGKGTVVAIGDGKLLADGSSTPLSVKVGDHVLFGGRYGEELKIGGEVHVLLQENDLLGVEE